MSRFQRTEQLFGDRFQSIQELKVVLFGVGGVGSFTLDCLYRSGVREITIVDFDSYEESNLNRQLGSDNNIGEVKVNALSKIYPTITPINIEVTPYWVEEFDFSKFDVVIDAIDDVDVKVALAHKVSDKLISSMGSANQIDPSTIQLSTIWKTEHDPFAKAIRTKLRKSGFKGSYPVVFSRGERIGERGGSFVGVTGSFGLALCSAVLNQRYREKL
jgi:tRNA A37 threonylcarbamoyladenosine dehydratase